MGTVRPQHRRFVGAVILHAFPFLGALHLRPSQWFTKAGFTDVKIKRIGPKWYRGVRRHGLIMGCSVTGVKPQVAWLAFSWGTRGACASCTLALQEWRGWGGGS